MLEFEQHIAERAKKKGINPVFLFQAREDDGSGGRACLSDG
jgi:hypothetical protein